MQLTSRIQHNTADIFTKQAASLTLTPTVLFCKKEEIHPKEFKGEL